MFGRYELLHCRLWQLTFFLNLTFCAAKMPRYHLTHASPSYLDEHTKQVILLAIHTVQKS